MSVAAYPVRVAGPADADAVAELMCAFRDWWGYEEPGDAAMRAGVERLLADPDTEFLLAGEPAAGVAQLRFRYGVWLDAPDCWLEDLFVREDARGSGLGRALVEAAVERARARGCRRLDLDVAADNAAARALYERMGFASPGEEGTYLMRLRLR